MECISGLLVILIANRQGAEDFMSRACKKELQQAAYVDYCQPAIEHIPELQHLFQQP